MKTCECGCGNPAPIAKKTDSATGRIKGMPQRFIKGHHSRLSPVEYIIDAKTNCWNWQRCKDKNGYGRVCIKDGLPYPAHRYYYEKYKGAIPKGYVIDHLCRNPACVNPSHLEPVTNAENIRRGKHIKLTIEQAHQIRAEYGQGNKTQNNIAKHYGVCISTISLIVNMKLWK